ncbi:hypothetical protein [Embleya scabrispora]|uniref:hypothetical protein n=1 Tax=Embleya scabrispora TaxID=159449 RepID=UPI00035D67A7|nr:hypothetical protein [Embleya scabrispora]MYS83914.1 hypothetical protein [Streptomyces sp. SID5474]
MIAYNGSGPYCYTHCLCMMLGSHAPAPAVVETLTGSPFGVQLVAGTTPFFDPFGWDPEIGLDAAIAALGWTCERERGGTADEAPDRLRAACARGPVLAGPLDLGLLTYRPGTPVANGGDHYVVVLAADEDTALVHDPQGYPYARLPIGEFTAAWRGASIAYLDAPYVLRTRFVRVREVAVADALRESLPAAVRWLDGRQDLPVPPGTLGGADALAALAESIPRGLAPDVRTLLATFGIRVGARRLNDAAGCLAESGLVRAARVAARQAASVGALQYPLVVEDDPALAAGLRQLAPTYSELRREIASALTG